MKKKVYIKIEQTQRNPLISLRTGEFIMKGRCHAENVVEYYKTVLSAVETYVSENKTVKTIVIFEMIYYDSGTEVIIREIIKKFSELDNARVRWYYETDDDDMCDEGKDFKQIAPKGLTFRIIEKKEKPEKIDYKKLCLEIHCNLKVLKTRGDAKSYCVISGNERNHVKYSDFKNSPKEAWENCYNKFKS